MMLLDRMKANGNLLFTLIFSVLLMAGCYTEPNFSNIPQIEITDTEYFRDTAEFIVLTFDFQDGDGDIGMYNFPDRLDFIKVGEDTLYSNAIFNLYRRSDLTGEYQLITNDELFNNGLNSFEFSIPVEGTINQGKDLSGSITQFFYQGDADANNLLNYLRDDSLYLEGYLYDREGNQSNISRSRTFSLAQYL